MSNASDQQGQPRIVPTRPGWWWRQGNRGPYVEEVDCDQNHAPFLAMDGSDVVDDGAWLAPIPGPAVLAALAEYGEALAGLDAEPNDRIPTVGIMRAFNDAGDALHAAIRAERDGAA